jgi:hypothetical protein
MGIIQINRQKSTNPRTPQQDAKLGAIRAAFSDKT